MANTPDPRDFYQVSRLLLVPSLWWESFGRVAAEALINGVPVLASSRGGLAETLEQAGILFDVPEKYTPETRLVPSAEEMAPWINTIIRLWDDHTFYEQERRRCLAAAEAWRPERLLPRFEECSPRSCARQIARGRLWPAVKQFAHLPVRLGRRLAGRLRRMPAAEDAKWSLGWRVKR